MLQAIVLGFEMDAQLKIKSLRKRIDQVDAQILKLLKKRAEIVLRIGKIKKLQGIPIRDMEREKVVLSRIAKEAKKLGLKSENAKAIYKEIIALCRHLEKK